MQHDAAGDRHHHTSFFARGQRRELLMERLGVAVALEAVRDGKHVTYFAMVLR
jgi:hypothetical protein